MAELPSEELLRWRGRTELARRHLDRHGDTEGRWQKNVRAMAGDFGSRAELGPEAIDVNMVRATVQTVLPPLWIAEPRIMVRPRVARITVAGQEIDNIRAAENTEIELNYWLRELRVREQMKKILLDAEAMNLGYLYLGWVGDEELESESRPEIQRGRPFILRHSPRRVLVPPGHDDLESCPWVALEFLRPLGTLKRIFGAAADGIEGELMDGLSKEQEEPWFKDYAESEDARLVRVLDVWDKDSGKVYKLARNHDKFLEEPAAWPIDVEGFPLVFFRHVEAPDEYFVTPPVSFYLPQNKELNATRTAMRKRRNRTKAVIFADNGLFPTEAVEKYKNAEDGEIITLDMSEGDLRQKMQMDTGIPFDQGDLLYEGTIKQDILLMSGAGAEQRGAGDPNIRSATASANVEKYSQVRQSDRSDRVRTAYLDLSRKLLMVIRQKMRGDITRIVPQAGRGWREMRYSAKELRGEFQFEMDLGAMTPDNPQTRQVEAITTYNLMRADPLVDPERLVFDVLRSQNRLDPEAYLVHLRTPEEELGLMLQGLPVEAHERDDHERHIAQHDQQVEQLAQDSTERVRIAQVLLISHVHQHVALLQRIEGASQRQPGTPVAENMLRSSLKVRPGGETQAEMNGQAIQ